MPALTVVFAYYESPQMLEYQLEQLGGLSRKFLNRIEILLVDDASPTSPALPIAAGFAQLPVSVFRINENRPWNQDAARNIGVAEASSSRVLLTDIDHVIPVETIEKLIQLDPGAHAITFARKAHFSDRHIMPHVNSFFLSTASFWNAGGYDEDFAGWYGTDKLFRHRLESRVGVKLRSDLFLELVTGGSISDAKNTTFSRKPSPWMRLRFVGLRMLKKARVRKSPKVLQNDYVKQWSTLAD